MTTKASLFFFSIFETNQIVFIGISFKYFLQCYFFKNSFDENISSYDASSEFSSGRFNFNQPPEFYSPSPTGRSRRFKTK